MKVSISLPDDDVAFLDRFASEHEHGSRSAAVQRAVRLLRASQLEHEYGEAFGEWSDADEQAWAGAVGDGLGG